MTRIDWDLLTRYLAGSCTPPERQWIEQVAAVDPETAHVVAGARELAGDGDAEVPPAEVAARLAAVKREGKAAARGVTGRPPSFALPAPVRRRSTMAIAAGLAAVAAIGVLAGRLTLGAPERPPSAGSAAFSVISTAPGQRISLRLSDGTLVSLAPATTLRTPAGYGTRGRTVELEGEAVFTVTHDSTRPFAVRTPRAVATDLGTRFAVRAYADDPATDVVVAEGRVAVGQAAAPASVSSDSVIIGRGERVRVSSDGRIELSRGVELDDYFGWTEGRLVFRGVPLREAARRLSRWYDIEIRLEPDSLGDRRVIAPVGNEPAMDVLHTIAVSLDLRLSRAGRVFTLSAN